MFVCKPWFEFDSFISCHTKPKCIWIRKKNFNFKSESKNSGSEMDLQPKRKQKTGPKEKYHILTERNSMKTFSFFSITWHYCTLFDPSLISNFEIDKTTLWFHIVSNPESCLVVCSLFIVFILFHVLQTFISQIWRLSLLLCVFSGETL